MTDPIEAENVRVIRVALVHDLPMDYDKLVSSINDSALASDIADSLGQNECKAENVAKFINASDIAEHVDADSIAESLAENIDYDNLAGHIDVSDVASNIDFSTLAEEFNTTDFAQEVVGELDYNRIIASLRKQPIVSDVAADNGLIARVSKLEETLTRMSGVLNDER